MYKATELLLPDSGPDLTEYCLAVELAWWHIIIPGTWDSWWVILITVEEDGYPSSESC
jgi:hypothetical protein